MKSALLFPFTCLVMCVSLLSVFSAGAATAGTLPHRQPAHPPTGQYKSTRTWFLPTTPFTIQRFSGKTCTQTYKFPESFTEMLHFLLHLGEKCQNPSPATRVWVSRCKQFCISSGIETGAGLSLQAVEQACSDSAWISVALC